MKSLEMKKCICARAASAFFSSNQPSNSGAEHLAKLEILSPSSLVVCAAARHNLHRAHDVHLGRVTNNVAEYAGSLMGLEAILRLGEKYRRAKRFPVVGATVGWGVSD